MSVLNVGMYETRVLFVLVLLLTMMIIIILNQLVSSSIAHPLEKIK